MCYVYNSCALINLGSQWGTLCGGCQWQKQSNLVRGTFPRINKKMSQVFTGHNIYESGKLNLNLSKHFVCHLPNSQQSLGNWKTWANICPERGKRKREGYSPKRAILLSSQARLGKLSFSTHICFNLESSSFKSPV